jgi:alpha-L-rhamnosidase
MKAFFLILLSVFTVAVTAAPTHLVTQEPVSVKKLAGGTILVDFGKVAFGNIDLLRLSETQTITVHFGEAAKDGRINRQPGGTIRYAQAAVTAQGKTTRVAPAADKRNTTLPAAILTPKEWGVVLPFRWVEIEGWKGNFTTAHIRRNAGFAATWQDDAATFTSSNPTLDQIWELCRYSIKATTFAGVYVDGDRERIPYEADAYLNQLSHYACDPDPQMARDTFDHLMKQPTWPSEWAQHLIFMVHADWMFTGDKEWMSQRFDSLKPKTLGSRAREDGLLVSNDKQIKRDDIVDWPVGERDGYVFTPVNTVVNAFHLRAVQLMREMAVAAGKTEDAKTYTAQYEKALAAFQAKLYNPATGLYTDGESTKHSSLHANLFPLAFGLIPEERKGKVIEFIKKRGMKCSVYAAQYLLEGLLEQGEGSAALELILADGDRSWKHMLKSGTTITWEAWDNKYKPNQDWNHAWGAAPANILPRYMIGVRPLEAGWSKILIQPQPASLTKLSSKIPSRRGPVLLKWQQSDKTWHVSLPEGVSARLDLPAASGQKAYIAGKVVAADAKNGRLVLKDEVTGKVSVTVK